MSASTSRTHRSPLHVRHLLVALAMLGLLATACAAALAQGGRGPGGAAGPTVVELTQDRGRFSPQRLTLDPGKYVFRVRNQGVDHPVAFRLSRIEEDGGIGDLVPNSTLPRSLRAGEVADTGAVELVPGKYTYRCALNPTPYYFIVVEPR